MNFEHKPVLLEEVIACFDYLNHIKNGFFVDGTLGLAGHSIAIAQNLNEKSKVEFIGIDKDQKALDIARDNVLRINIKNDFTFIHEDSGNIKDILSELNILKINGMLLDLGVSSMQLDDKSRGFSFSDPEATLDMRMDQEQTLTAAYILNNYSENELRTMLRNGEEKHFNKVAKYICLARKNKPIDNVGELLDILQKALPNKYYKTHFATDTFRALRLEVNDEISKLSNSISGAVGLLDTGSKLAIITFHSIEDRIVKDTFREMENPCTCPPKIPYCVCGKIPKVKILTKKPLTASENELQINPRSRSAKLRIVEKI